MRSLMMFERFLAVAGRSLMISEEFWASRCDLSGCLRSFDRHGPLSHDFCGVLGVTVRSLMISEELWASRRDNYLMMFADFWASRCTLS